MANTTTKATFYLDSELYKTLKVKAALTDTKISALMNEALRAQLSEDLEDITTIRNRQAKKEQPLSYKAALKELQRNDAI